jgi:hypothetical protein
MEALFFTITVFLPLFLDDKNFPSDATELGTS